MTVVEAAKELGLAPSTLRPGKGNYVHGIRPAAERFWSKVRIGRSTDCWEWTGARHPKGYGNFAGEGWRPIAAHRFAWQDTNGPILHGLHVLHTCDNPPCVNPMHLYLGTNADNVRDKMARGRWRIQS